MRPTAQTYPTNEAGSSLVPPNSKDTAPRRSWPIGLLGIPFENVTQAEAVARVDSMIASRRPHYVVTANVDFLVQAQRDVELRRILLAADLVLCDGTPLLWASRWLGNPLPERVAGSDVTPLLIAAAAQRGHRLFFLGAQPGVATEAAARLRRQYPTLVIAGEYSPPFGKLLEINYAEIALRVRSARPDLIFVSFGCPKQEKWIAMHYQRLGVPVIIGVGATLDFIAGRLKRAPRLMQRTGTEFIYRLAQEPRRLVGRYTDDLVHFLPAITRQCISLRARPPQASAPLTVTASLITDGWQQIRIQGDLTAASLHQHPHAFDEVAVGTSSCRLDMSDVRFLDSTGAALLVQWHHRLHEYKKQLIIQDLSVAVQSTLQLLHLTSHFNVPLGSLGGTSQHTRAVTGDPVVPPYPGGHTVAWQGEITAANAEAVWDLTLRYLEAVGPPPRHTFMINIARLSFIDSSGAELMARMYAWSQRNQTGLRFIGVRPDVRNVLDLAGLSSLVGCNI